MNRYPYGSRTNHLPKFMLNSDTGVRILTAEQHNQAEAASLSRFQATGSGIVWDGIEVLARMAYDDEPDESRLLQQCLTQYTLPNSDIVLFSEIAGAPTVAIPRPTILTHMTDIVEGSGNLWLFDEADQIIIEALTDGTITVAKVP